MSDLRGWFKAEASLAGVRFLLSLATWKSIRAKTARCPRRDTRSWRHRIALPRGTPRPPSKTRPRETATAT